MFQDLLSLLGGWYYDYVEAVRDMLQYDVTELVMIAVNDGEGGYVSDTVTNSINPDIWSAYVPWEHIICAIVLIVFVCCIFKFMRSLLCKIL